MNSAITSVTEADKAEIIGAVAITLTSMVLSTLAVMDIFYFIFNLHSIKGVLAAV